MRNCKNCSELFENKSRSQRYCSIQCQFWKNVNKGTDDQCWNWIGKSRYDYGYGKINLRLPGGKPKYYRAHRLSLLIHGITLSAEDKACHNCDNPACVNPKHLFIGTQRDNVLDMRAKRRGSNPPVHYGDNHPLRKNKDIAAKGSKNGNSKLNEEAVRLIRTSTQTGAYLSKILHISQSTISSIKKGKTWRHVDV